MPTEVGVKATPPAAPRPLLRGDEPLINRGARYLRPDSVKGAD